MKLKTVIILIIITIVLTILVMNTVSGESIGEFQQSRDVEIYQTCNNCTFCNFTRVMKLNNQTILDNLEATKDGTYFYYNIDSGNFSDLGEYNYCYDCGNSIERETGCIEFEITYTGFGLSTPTAWIYILGLGFLLFLLLIMVWFINKLPSKDIASEDGRLMQINSLKHLRTVLWIFAWFIVLGMLFIISNLTLAHLPNSMLGDLFFRLYTILFWMTIVAVPVVTGWTIYKFFREKEVRKMIERGIEFGVSP